MKKLITVIFLLCFNLIVRADEGMWVLYLLGDKVYNDMVKKGLKLSREQIYSMNKASLKDAIVIFGGGCTGEVVSREGLIFTNHHCGYGAIAAASSVEKNYLRDGFWAKSKNEEIPAPSLSVQFLVRIEDVTPSVEKELAGLSGSAWSAKLQEVSQRIVKNATEGTGYEARVVPFYRGNQFLLFVYERYRDVRLVGTPPESIGKFGGDTDNWEWPRHTGDFAVFRVYADKNGKPAAYSPDNVPLRPKYHLPVSIKGVKENDFTMVLGYPGSTNRYETSYGVKLKTDVENPAIVRLRDVRLRLMFDEMKKDPAVRLQLASSYASIANYWKFFDGEAKQLLKYDVYGQKKAAEETFKQWAKGKPEYENLMAEFEKAYAAWLPYAKHRIYLNEGILGSPLAAYGASLLALERALTRKPANPEEINRIAENVNRARTSFLENENKASDERILAATCHMFYTDIARDQHPEEFFRWLRTAYGDPQDESTYTRFASDVFRKTMILDDTRWQQFISKPDSSTLQNDLLCRYVFSFIKNYNNRFGLYAAEFNNRINDLGRLYMKGIMQMNPQLVSYPDANFTMRLSYGSVKPYRPRDGVIYDYTCTITGVLEKYKPGDYEFDLPKELIEAANKKDFGIYKDARLNNLVVCFITNNDITGGNSGSPVLNGNGELIGLAFDGNYEALSHKIAFDKDMNRTICVDVRYVLWCIDKLGGAKHIINELTLR
ncbi:MAG: S46 family peptidase [Cyclobacteriaceae bacterium]|nr:S46 family peptidase [Cyclobacteriaceae bacterium]MDW8330025.1 S46 family peptidase [Cyclobacteriaceae bacterium]